MNKNMYRIVFNQSRGQLMVVAENTPAQGKTTTDAQGQQGAAFWQTLKPIRHALCAALGMIMLTGVQAQVVTDPNAPKSQQPTVLTTSNGVTQVNIQTPSAAGVSRNTYKQFDVDPAGVVLNNSRGNVQSQLGGWVQGNPWLAKGTARVILNEVTGSNPSQLRGYLEVAGSRAQVIIANPAGISCDGCGFINASRATLTTGSAMMSGGNLDGFRVTQGTISILGNGLDARQTDYTDLIARAIQVNAGVWANDLRVVAGASQISAEGSAIPTAGTGSAPSYAIDVAQLGGMYAGKIHLVGTESGLGVRNSGQIGAMAGDVAITLDGKLVNAGAISSSQHIQIDTSQGLENVGTVYAKSNTSLTTTGSVNNQGTLAAQGNLNIQATSAGSEIRSVGVLAAGLNEQGTLTESGVLSLNSRGSIIASGQNLSGNQLTMLAGTVNLGNSHTGAATVKLSANTTNLDLNKAEVMASQQLDLQASQRLITDGAKLSAEQVNVQAEALSNIAGTIIQTGTGDLRLQTPGAINNEAGLIATNSQRLQIAGSEVINTRGKIEHVGSGSATIVTNNFAGAAGQIQSNASLEIQATRLDLSEAKTLAKKIDLTAEHVSNRAGQIISTGNESANIVARSALDNTNGAFVSNGRAALSTGSLNNQGGVLQSVGTLELLALGRIDNSKFGPNAGSIYAGEQLSITAQSVDNRGGKLTSAAAIEAKVAQEFLNQEGTLAAAQNLSLNAHQIDNHQGTIGSVSGQVRAGANAGLINTQGRIEAAQSLTIKSANLANQTGIVQATQIDIDTHGGELNNQNGVLQATGQVTVNSGKFDNDSGLVHAKTILSINTHGAALLNTNSGSAKGIIGAESVQLSAGDLTNTAGFIGSKGALEVRAEHEIQNGGTISSEAQIALQAQSLNNLGGQIQSISDVTVSANSISNRNSLIRSGQKLQLNAQMVDNQSTVLSNQGLEGQQLSISAQQIENQQGAIRAEAELSLLSTNSLNNNQGLVSAGSKGTITSQAPSNQLAFSNTQGSVIAGQELQINTATLTGAGQLLSKGDLTLKAHGDYTHSGVLQAQGLAKVEATGTLTNQGRLLSADQLVLTANHIDNTAVGEISAGSTKVVATGTLTNRGLIDGVETRLSAATLNNLGTGRIYGDHLAIQANVLNNGAENGLAAVIAARSRLDIAAGTINNTDHGLIFSAGDLVIGGAMGSNWQATGAAGAVVNRGATIESLGAMQLGANYLTNSNANFSTQLVQTVAPVAQTYIQPTGNPNKYLLSNFVWQNWSRAGLYRWATNPPAQGGGQLGQSPISSPGAELCSEDEAADSCARKLTTSDLLSNPAWAYFGVSAPTAEPQAPALTKPVAPDAARADSCVQGAGYDAAACALYNNDLQQFNTQQAAYTTAWQSYNASYQSWITDTEAKYDLLDEKVDAYNSGFSSTEIKAWTQYQVTHSEAETRVLSSDPGKILSGGQMVLQGGQLLNDKSQIIAGGTLSGDLGNLSNVAATGQRIIHEVGTSQATRSRWRGGLKRYHQRDWDAAIAYAPADQVTTIDLAVSELKGNAQFASSSQGASALSRSLIAAATSGVQPVSVLVRDGQPINRITEVPVINTQATAGLSRVIRTANPNVNLPNNSLFKQNPNTASGFLIETDPRFANYRNWLGSDYMLSALRTDPTTIQKRLGDGFYEQKLVREQIAQLTGRRFLASYANDETQYQALMDNGVAFAKQWQLRPGVALSAEQMAQLSSDIVWLVEKEVVLADGTPTRVLVPQVYVKVQPGDLKGDGTLIAGDSVDLKVAGDLQNGGTIAGRQVVALTAENVKNLGGRISAADVALTAKNDLQNLGGLIEANRNLVLTAGRDLTIESTTQSGANQVGASSFKRTQLDRVAGLYIRGADVPSTNLLVSAGRDLTLAAAQVTNQGQQGNTQLVAGRDLSLKTVQTEIQENNVRNATNYLKQGGSQEVGSTIQAAGSIQLAAGNNIVARAATVTSEQGTISALAKNDIRIEAGQASTNYSEGHEIRNKGTLKTTTTLTRDQRDATQSISTTFSGDQVAIQAGHDLSIVGSQIAATQDVNLSAKNDLTIAAATDTYTENHFKQVTTKGFMSNGGLSFTYGKQRQSSDSEQEGTQQSQSRSMVGSEKGNVTLQAGNTLKVAGSDVTAMTGDIAATAKAITLTAGEDQNQSRQTQKFEQKGLTVAITSPVITAIQTTADMGKIASKTKDGRVALIAGATAGFAAKNGYDAYQSGSKKLGGVNVSISFGQSKSESTTTTDSSTQSASYLTAGGNLKLNATGAGKDSDINVVGSQLRAGKDLMLAADGDITLQAARNTNETRSKNSSSSSSLGVSVGTDVPFSVTASANKSKGNGNGNDLEWQNSQLTAGNTLTLKSGGDTNLIGASASGKQIVADVRGNLNIESLQDTSKYDSQQKSIGGSISVGAGKVSGSLNAGRDKMHADYAAVNEQSGLKAGDGGFNITVKGNTDLKGAVITSSAEESKNQLTTGSLTVSDIKNHAEYNASSMGLGVGVGDVGKTIDGLMSTGGQVVPGTEKSGDGLKANTPILLSASGDESSTTQSAIATGKITITNEVQQQQLTGKAADETVARLNRDTNNTAGKLNNNFDKAQVEEAFTVTKAFINETSTFVANRAKEAAKAKQEYDQAVKDGADVTTLERLKTVKEDAEKWGPGGTYGQAITVFQAAAGGNVTGGMTNLVQNAVVAYVQSLAAEEVKKIADSFMKDGKETADSQNIRTALHALVGCAGAAATGQSCNSAAVGAASSVVLNNLISEIQKTDAEHMTAEQKENRKNLVGTVIGGIVAAAGGDAVVANSAAQIEMENNYLSPSEKQKLIQAEKNCSFSNKAACDSRDKLKKLDRDRNTQLAQEISSCKTEAECQKVAIKITELLQQEKNYQALLNTGAGGCSQVVIGCTPEKYASLVADRQRQLELTRNDIQALTKLGNKAVDPLKIGEKPLVPVIWEDLLIPGLKGATNLTGRVVESWLEKTAVKETWQATSNLSPRVFVGQDVSNAFGQGGAVINGRYIRSVPEDISASYQGMGYLDPLSNTFKPAPLGKTMPVDHIYSVRKIQERPGFNRLTVDDQISIIHDRIDVGNFQPLPQTFNSSKGSKLDWSFYKDQPLDPVYKQNLINRQMEIEVEIQRYINQRLKQYKSGK